MRSPTLAALSLMLLAPAAVLAQQNLLATDPCARFKWDVSSERALFAGTASPVTAGKSAGSAPRVAAGRLYRVTLAPAAEVLFSTPPGKPSPTGATYSGILTLRVPAAGSYRISVDAGMWIDVVSDARLLPAADYEGQHECAAPRKIVQFALDATRPLLVQLSGAGAPEVRIAIVRAAGD